jgi:hypothetical protein
MVDYKCKRPFPLRQTTFAIYYLAHIHYLTWPLSMIPSWPSSSSQSADDVNDKNESFVIAISKSGWLGSFLYSCSSATSDFGFHYVIRTWDAKKFARYFELQD